MLAATSLALWRRARIWQQRAEPRRKLAQRNNISAGISRLIGGGNEISAWRRRRQR